MIGMILAHPHLFWLSLGGLLLAAEMLGGSGYLLWSGVAGVVTGALTWLLPLSWELARHAVCRSHPAGGVAVVEMAA